MKRSCVFWTLFLPSGALAKVFSRSLLTNGGDFASRDYDYVIIGGGTAGLAVAARLSEDPNVSVGVIEAGAYLLDDPLIDTPRSAGAALGNPKYDWMFQSVPQPGLNGRVVDLPRGKVVGGSSAASIYLFGLPKMNTMVGSVLESLLYTTHAMGCKAWATLGSPGWNWNNLLPYMKAAEKFTGTDPFRVNATGADSGTIYPSQGTTGAIAASYNTWYSDTVNPYDQTMINLGIPQNFDPISSLVDSGDPFGLYNSATSVNLTTGKRSYAANTYYAYNAGRSNLVVLTGGQVTKINFSNATSANKKLMATSVSFVSNSTTFSSPQLLELSGIGNSTILKKYGITPLVDLPGVGENLQDHGFLATSYELKPGKTTLDILRNNATFAAEARAQYTSTHDGIYTATVSTLSFVNLGSFLSKTKIAALTAKLNRETASNTTPLQKAQYAIQKKWLKEKKGHIELLFYASYFGAGIPKANMSYVSLLLVDQHPFSRGSAHINTTDPLVKAACDPNYFSKAFDLDTLVEAVKFGLKISQTEPLASSIVFDPTDGLMGTAALAPRTLGGVVDPRLKVYGTTNVRVVDAGVVSLHMGIDMTSAAGGE
ncbi:alcohol oxidase [Ceratobasidium sp. AG-I]|nr:alcohol oxidase [Ceratobasidium sp. AG-I]